MDICDSGQGVQSTSLIVVTKQLYGGYDMHCSSDVSASRDRRYLPIIIVLQEYKPISGRSRLEEQE
jgi:hypothetical protein